MHTSPQATESAPSGAGGLHALVRTRDGWAVQHAIITVTDMYGNQVVRTEADAEGAVMTDPLAPGSTPSSSPRSAIHPSRRRRSSTTSGPPSWAPRARTAGRCGTAAARRVDHRSRSFEVAAIAQHLGLSSVQGGSRSSAAGSTSARTAEKSSVAAVIKAASITTGNGTRDDHLRSADFLGVESHPTISYRSIGPVRHGSGPVDAVRCPDDDGITRSVDLDLSYLGTSPDPWGGLRAAFRAVTELRREDFAMNYNQVVQAGISLIGTTLRVELDIQAIQGNSRRRPDRFHCVEDDRLR